MRDTNLNRYYGRIESATEWFVVYGNLINDNLVWMICNFMCVHFLLTDLAHFLEDLIATKILILNNDSITTFIVFSSHPRYWIHWLTCVCSAPSCSWTAPRTSKSHQWRWPAGKMRELTSSRPSPRLSRWICPQKMGCTIWQSASRRRQSWQR